VGYLSLNRPDKYNAFDGQMVASFEQFWRDGCMMKAHGLIILDGGEAKGFAPAWT